MPLDDDYLRYAKRRYGVDHERYPWRTRDTRTPISWRGDATVACMIVVPIEHHPLDPSGKPFRPSGAMVTPYPDLRHYTSRDYGNRVGVYRILDALADHDLIATFPINACAIERLRPLVDAIVDGGHEIAAYGLSTDHLHWGGLDRATEEAWVGEVRQRFDDAGLHPRTWLSPARQQSFATLDLISAAGFDVCLDWEQDTVPLAMQTSAKPVVALALSNELDDRALLMDRRQTEDDWVDQVLDAIDYTAGEAPRRGGQMLGFTLTPYVTGQPFRTAAVRRLLEGIAARPDAWCATATAIAQVAAC